MTGESAVHPFALSAERKGQVYGKSIITPSVGTAISLHAAKVRTAAQWLLGRGRPPITTCRIAFRGGQAGCVATMASMTGASMMGPGVTAGFETGRRLGHGGRHVETVVAHVPLVLRGHGRTSDQAERDNDHPCSGAAHSNPF